MICIVSEHGYIFGSESVSTLSLSALWVTLWHTTGLFCLCCGRWEEPLLSVYDCLRTAVVVMSPCWKYANCLCVLVQCSSPWQVTMVPSVAFWEQWLYLSLPDQHSHHPFRPYTLSEAIADTKRREKSMHHLDKDIPAHRTRLWTYPLHACSFMCKQIGSMMNKHKRCQACMQ